MEFSGPDREAVGVRCNDLLGRPLLSVHPEAWALAMVGSATAVTRLGAPPAAVMAWLIQRMFWADTRRALGCTLKTTELPAETNASARPSRKSFIGHLTGAVVEERLPGSLAALAAAQRAGATIVRVHDVAATRRALDTADAVLGARR